MKVRSFSVTSVEALEELLHEPENRNINLGFVFSSDYFPPPVIQSVFRTHGASLFGTTSREEISGTRLSRKTISGLLLTLPEQVFSIAGFRGEDSFSLGRQVGSWASGFSSDPRLITALGGIGVQLVGDNFLKGIQDASPGTPVFGGLASGLKDLRQPKVYTLDEEYPHGSIACVFDGNEVDVRGLAVSGWREIGTAKTVTKARGNVLYSVDGEPALDFYRRYFKFGDTLDDQIMITEYPLSVRNPDGSRVMRIISDIDREKGSLIYGGTIQEGAQVRFCSPNIIETLTESYQELSA